MIKKRRFKIYDMDGNPIISGTSGECCKKLGCSYNSLTRFAQTTIRGTNTKYEVIEIDPVERENKEGVDRRVKDAIKAWDDFVTPIRKRYGVPVRHLGEK